jgi:hypothetical protein
MSAAHYLAHEIEWMHAKDRVRIKQPRLRKVDFKAAVCAEFDAHAATELASLIEIRMRKGTP